MELSEILIDGQDVDMTALRNWLLGLDDRITNGIDAAALAAALSVVYETRAELDADLAHDADVIALVWGDATDANNDFYVKVGASGAGSWTLTTILHDTLSNLANPFVLRAQIAVPFDTWAALAGSTGAEDGDRATVLSSDLGTHTDPVAAGTVLNAGVYQFDAATPGWERVGDLDSQIAAQAGAARERFGSITFPLENGWSLNPELNCEFRLPGFETGMTSLGSGNFFQNAWTFVTFFEPARDLADAQNVNLPMWSDGINDNPATNRIIHLSYYTAYQNDAPLRRHVRFIARGETAASAAIDLSVEIPSTATGPFAAFGSSDGTNTILSVYDIGAGVWYDGAVEAVPAGWVGIGIFRSPFTIGGEGNYTWPRDPGTQPFNAVSFKGAMADILFCDAELAKADVEAMAEGAGVVATATGGGATEYLHIPLVDSDGAVDLAVATTQSGMSAGLTQLGRPIPGPTLRRQATAEYITVNSRKWPDHCTVEPGSTAALVQATITTDMVGDIEFRPVRAGVALDDWRVIANAVPAGTTELEFDVQEFTGDAQFQFRSATNADVIAVTHAHCRTGPAVDIFSQSEGVLATVAAFDRSARDDTLNIRAEGRTDTILFAHIAADGAYPRVFHLAFLRSQPGWLGDPAMAIANDLRRATDRSILIRLHTVSGTGITELMNDADTDRQWSDVDGLNALAGNRGPRGETVSHGAIFVGWDAAFSGTVLIMRDWYRPFLTGVESAIIAQADIDHWLFDGTFSDTMRVVILPNNRALGPLAGLGASDQSTEADQRDVFRNYSHILGYQIGPEATTHKLQGENAAGGIPTSGGTHPEDGDFEGGVEMALGVSEAIRMVIGIGRYPGPVFFSSIRAGSAANKVIVTLGEPDPTPGSTLAEGSTGYRTGARDIVRAAALNLHTKKEGGDPGACFEANIDGGGWSLLNVTAGVILNPREVELTLASAPVGNVQIRYMPGATGGYSTATITQENWRSGALFFTGEPYTGAEPAAWGDMKKLGFAVAGSNQALVHNV